MAIPGQWSQSSLVTHMMASYRCLFAGCAAAAAAAAADVTVINALPEI